MCLAIEDVENSEEVLKIGRKLRKQRSRKLNRFWMDKTRHTFVACSLHLIIKKKRRKSALIGRRLTVLLIKFEEEWQEFQEEVENGTKESQTDELGDVLFTIVNISRFLKLSPEEAMVHANQKFKSTVFIRRNKV